MRLLVITQKVDQADPILGFFHRWLEIFASQFTSLTVICLQAGEFSLPANTRVFSLGKEKKVSRLQYVMRFYRYIWKYRHDYDAVLVHMNPLYVPLGAIVWKFLQKPIYLWYIHPKKDKWLYLAVPLIKSALSATKESFPFDTPKLKVIGHGIDTDYLAQSAQPSIPGTTVRLLFVGRLAPVKNLDLLIDVAEELQRQKVGFFLEIVGSSDAANREYGERIKARTVGLEKAGLVQFSGAITPLEMRNFYAKADLLLNLTTARSFDKVVLETMASHRLVLTTNPAFREFLPDSHCLVDPETEGIVAGIKWFADLDPKVRTRLEKLGQERIIAHHSLKNLVKKLV